MAFHVHGTRGCRSIRIDANGAEMPAGKAHARRIAADLKLTDGSVHSALFRFMK